MALGLGQLNLLWEGQAVHRLKGAAVLMALVASLLGIAYGATSGIAMTEGAAIQALEEPDIYPFH